MIAIIGGCSSNNKKNNTNSDLEKQSKINIEDIDWKVKQGIVDGDRYALLDYTNNTPYTITHFELTFEEKDDLKEEDKEKITKAKQENLKGILVKGSDIEKNVPQEIEIDDNCYYLNNDDLKDIGIQNYSIDKYGYIIVKYDFKNTMVEVISTKGYNGKHTLTQLIDD